MSSPEPSRLDIGSRTDTIVALAGDWHGDLVWAERSIRYLAKRGVRTIYHLGDFGFWGGKAGDKYLHRVNSLAASLEVQLVVTPGNHENWRWLDALFAKNGSVELARFESNIWVAPRGCRWIHAGRTFVSLGGAPSVDLDDRVPGVDWWPGEAITREDSERTAAGGQAEIMLTHDSGNVTATPAIRRILEGPSAWSKIGLAYATVGRRRLDEAIAGVRPTLFAHGHYHVADDAIVDGCRVLSLQMNGAPRNLALLDLESQDFSVEWIETF